MKEVQYFSEFGISKIWNMGELFMNARDQNNILMRNRKIKNLTPVIVGERQYLPDWWKQLKFWGHPRDFGHSGSAQNVVYARIWGDIVMARAWYSKFPNFRSNDDYSQKIIFMTLKFTEHEKIWNVFFEVPITVGFTAFRTTKTLPVWLN